ncbi:TRAP transporter substrate-binding protein [Teredinibacter franksiae]|uniref:TRAP transporter substrate-binding protein n=1 Tax=Teredinibacter franksiae TaxID=2761453 RepID=UPI001FE67076|nr:TRAP transporter substrate-binding protein [Teredinibacter franksiae]
METQSLMPRYSPWWMPAAIILLLGLCVLMFALLVINSGKERNAPVNTISKTEQQIFEWKMVTTWPKNFPGLGLAPENFARMVGQMSAGRLKIRVHGANEIVPAMGVFGAVSSGSVQMGHGAAYYWKGKIPSSVFFTSVPFGMNAQELNGWLHYGGGLELWRELYEPFNLIPFAAGNTGVQMGGWFNREINSMDDINGLKMRIPGIGGEVFSRAGGEAINIPGGELYTALQSGVIDATEWVGPYNDLAFGFHQIAQYYYYPGWHEPGPALEIIVNKGAYNSLPDDLKAVVEAAARMVNQDMLDEYTARNNAALVELVDKHGVQLRRFPDDVLAEFKAISEELYVEMSASDPTFAKIYAAYSEYLVGLRDYHALTEKAYYQTR